MNGGGASPGSDQSVKQLSHNISAVIADLRAKLRKNSAGNQGLTAPTYKGGSSQTYGTQNFEIPKHFGGFHRSSFLKKLRKR